MASFFEMILKTMPFAAAVNSIAAMRNKKREEVSAADMREHVQLLPEGAAICVELPPRDSTASPEYQPLWSFTYSTARPAEVGAVYCRVRDADYVGHQVAERIAWGMEEPGGEFKSEIDIKLQAGASVRLPLTADFLLWAFRVNGCKIDGDQTPLWRLESVLDASIVAVFAYDLDPATGQLMKTDFEKVHDRKQREDLQEMAKAVQELGTVAPVHNDQEAEPDQPDPVPVGQEQPWGERVLRGPDFWPAHNENSKGAGVPTLAGMGGQVGQTVDLQTEPARLLVVFSLTTCRERADFEPGAMVGFARCYPHLLVSATVPVSAIEGAAHIDRPQTLSKWHEEGRDMSASCCKPPHDGWTPEIGSLLVTDVNIKPNAHEPWPFWSNMFFYYQVDPYLAHGGRKYHVIRRDRPTARDSGVPLVSRTVVGARDYKQLIEDIANPYQTDHEAEDNIVRKEARQGAFDNIHMAPRLRLMNVTHVRVGGADREVANRAAWHLDDIAMAPFCAHDCLHIHWRWAGFATAKSALGWDATGPYRVAGAPLVPLEQNVWVRFRRRASLTYHVQSEAPQYVDGWHVLMHHGFGYAVAIQDIDRTGQAMNIVSIFAGHEFVGAGGGVVDAKSSTAAYYWTARFSVEATGFTARLKERLSWASDAVLDQAIDL